MVVLDTSIIIDHLRQKNNQQTALMKIVDCVARESLALSVISVQELYEGRSTKEKAKEDYLLATIVPLRILPYSYEVAQLAGEIARDLEASIEFADAAIASTALVNGALLYTLNKKHFEHIQGIEFWEA